MTGMLDLHEMDRRFLRALRSASLTALYDTLLSVTPQTWRSIAVCREIDRRTKRNEERS